MLSVYHLHTSQPSCQHCTYRTNGRAGSTARIRGALRKLSLPTPGAKSACRRKTSDIAVLNAPNAGLFTVPRCAVPATQYILHTLKPPTWSAPSPADHGTGRILVTQQRPKVAAPSAERACAAKGALHPRPAPKPWGKPMLSRMRFHITIALAIATAIACTCNVYFDEQKTNTAHQRTNVTQG